MCTVSSQFKLHSPCSTKRSSPHAGPLLRASLRHRSAAARQMLDDVRTGTLDAGAASVHIRDAFAFAPFEDSASRVWIRTVRCGRAFRK